MYTNMETQARSIARHSPSARLALITALSIIAGCASTPPPQTGPTLAATPAHSRQITLSEANKWRLQLSLSLDEEDNPKPGTYEFRSLRCGGTYTYGSRMSNGSIVLNQNLTYGNCVKNCTLVLAADFSSYRELCKGRPTGSGELSGGQNIEQARDPRAAALKAARLEREASERAAKEQRELEALRQEATSARLPAQITRIRASLAGRDAAAEKQLEASLAAFVAGERQRIALMAVPELRSFIETRRVDSEDPNAAASPEGLAFAASELQRRYTQLAESGSREQLEDLLKAKDLGDAAKKQTLQRLRAEYLQKREFGPMHRLYELTGDIAFVASAIGFARTTAELAQLEAAAVKGLHSPGWLLEYHVSAKSGSASARVKENMGLFANFTSHVSAPVGGEVTVKLRPTAPIKLRHNSYRVVLSADLLVDRTNQLRSGFLGNRDTSDPVRKSITTSVVVGPPNYQASTTFSFGQIDLGYFQSGSHGGYTAIFPTDEGKVSVRINSISLAQ
jgi:hypothetical protein